MVRAIELDGYPAELALAVALELGVRKFIKDVKRSSNDETNIVVENGRGDPAWALVKPCATASRRDGPGTNASS